MARYNPPSIKKIGLEKHLNNTVADHNNKNYADFCDLMESQIEPKVANIVRVFGVGRPTATKWVKAWESENDGQL
jgi:hypothetical protein